MAVKHEFSAGDPYVPERGDDGYRTRHYDLALTYRPESNRLEATATIRMKALRKLDRFALDLAGLSVGKVRVDGRPPKRYQHKRDKLVITPVAPIAVGTVFRVDVPYSGNPRPVSSRWGNIGWEELSAGSIVAGQPVGAPSWFPCNDHPSDKAPFRISVTTDTPYTVIANGVLREKKTRASTTTWVYEMPEPMATYLASVQIGNYEIRELPGRDTGKGPVPVRVARPPRLAKNAAADFAKQHRMIATFTELFGPYPFDGYTAVVTDDPLEIPLEAQSFSIFGANHVDGHGGSERLIAHELAHQWFGNQLTVRRWQDIWLHEGFACYAEWLWSEESGGDSADEHAHRYWKRLRDSRHDLVLADPGPDTMFDDRVYKRGACTLHALRSTIGSKRFFKMLHEWVAEHRGKSVDTEQFVALAVSVGGKKVGELLHDWLYETKLPKLP